MLIFQAQTLSTSMTLAMRSKQVLGVLRRVLEYRQKATVLKAKFELLALLKQPLV